jgi:hypothetical protein
VGLKIFHKIYLLGLSEVKSQLNKNGKDILSDLNIGDSSAISISFFTIRNYLLYILPEYLAPNMSFPNNMVNIIFGDTDDISLEFSDLVDDLAVQYMNNLPKPTKIS